MRRPPPWRLPEMGQPMPGQVGTMAGTDAMRERIEAYSWPRGGVEVVRANRGYTLYSRRTGGQVARLRPTGKNDDVESMQTRGGLAGSPVRVRSGLTERGWAGGEAGVACEAGGRVAGPERVGAKCRSGLGRGGGGAIWNHSLVCGTPD